MFSDFLDFVKQHTEYYNISATTNDDKKVYISSYELMHLSSQMIVKLFRDNFSKILVMAYFKNSKFISNSKFVNNKIILELDVQNSLNDINVINANSLTVYPNSAFEEKLIEFYKENNIFNYSNLCLSDEISKINKHTFRKIFKLKPININSISITRNYGSLSDRSSFLYSEFNYPNMISLDLDISSCSKNYKIALNKESILFEDVSKTLSLINEKINYINDRAKSLFKEESKLLLTFVNNKYIFLTNVNDSEDIIDVLKELALNNKPVENPNEIINFYKLICQFKNSVKLSQTIKPIWLKNNYFKTLNLKFNTFEFNINLHSGLISKICKNNCLLNFISKAYDPELVNILEKEILTNIAPF